METIQFLDPEQFNQANEKLDFKFILMRQIDKVRLSRSTEMMGGYWDNRIISVGGGVSNMQVYVPDTRETYINAVKSLRSLLIPYWDDMYNEEETKHKETYNSELKSEIERIKKLEHLDDKQKEFNLNDDKGHIEKFWKPKQKIIHYDLIFEALLKLSVRAKLINGNNLIDDNI